MSGQPVYVVIPPKPSRFRKFIYPLWFFWANKIRWPLISAYIGFRQAIGPRCEDCGRGYWKTCTACEFESFMRERRLEELRGEGRS